MLIVQIVGMLIMICSLTHSDSDSCAPEVMVQDARGFSSIKNEQKYPWLYDSVVHQGYLCKFCELFCSHSSSSQEFVTVGINLGKVSSLFYYWTFKLINLLLFSSFPNSYHLRANFRNYKGPGPQTQMSRKIIVMCYWLACDLIPAYWCAIDWHVTSFQHTDVLLIGMWPHSSILMCYWLACDLIPAY